MHVEQPDFDDVAFYDAAEHPLDFSRLSTSINAAEFWVEVPSVVWGSTNQTEIRIAYGNATVESASDPESTFLFWDDFDGGSLDAEKWNHAGSNITIANGMATITDASGSAVDINTTSTFGDMTAVDARMLTLHSNGVNANEHFFVGANTGSNYQAAWFCLYLATSSYRVRDHNGALRTSPMRNWTGNEFHVLSLTRNDAATWTVDRIQWMTTMAGPYRGDERLYFRAARNTSSTDQAMIKVDWVLVRAASNGSITIGTWGEEVEHGSGSPAPTADFAANVTSGMAPLAVQFTDTSTVLNPTGWYWEFGDTGTSTDQHPMHVYEDTGSFTVNHRVTNASGSDWENKSAYITTTTGDHFITLDSPFDDTTINGSIVVAGSVADPLVPNVTIGINGVNTTIPVTDSNFSAIVNLTEVTTLIVSAVDSGGQPESITLLLDGDMLPADFELEIGFDPLDPDSDCSATQSNEANNGTLDGYEIFDGKLPVFAKYRIGADPFDDDTDDDGLTDSFELLKLGSFPENTTPPESQKMLSTLRDSYRVDSGTDDDPDDDGLTNIEEQEYGTDPLTNDTDTDGILDPDELQEGTDPCDPDSDHDLLLDGHELILGTDPLDNDTNDNGQWDGNETYWSTQQFVNQTLNLTVRGRGYAIQNVTASAVNYTHLISDEILVSGVYDVRFGTDTSYGTVAITYDPTHIENASTLSMYRFDEEYRTFVPVSSTVNAGTHVVTANVTNSSKYAVLDTVGWDALFYEEQQGRRSSDRSYVRLRVRNSVNSTAVAGVHVTVNLEDQQMADTNTTGYSGYFSIPITFDRARYETQKTGYYNHVGAMPIFEEEADQHRTDECYINPVGSAIGSVDVFSSPTYALIYVDGVYRGVTDTHVSDILAGWHTVEVRKAGYITNSTSVYVPQNEHPDINLKLFPLPAQGSIHVTSNPPGANVTVDGSHVGTTSLEYGILLVEDVPVGLRYVGVTKEGYYPYSGTAYVEEDDETAVYATLQLIDGDEDGLNATDEENGFRDGFGNVLITDPDLIDTDGDNLTDGYEAGEAVEINGKIIFKARSDPTKVDTDGDGLNDDVEDDLDSDAFSPDSDSDGLSDKEEWEVIGTDVTDPDTDGDGHNDGEEHYDPDYDPLVFEERYGPLEMGRDFVLGAVFGEWGAEENGSIFYAGGWVASGVVILGDIRDIGATIANGDLIGTGLNMAALIPAYGDAAKAGEVVGKFIVKHPEVLKPALDLLVGVAPGINRAAETIKNMEKIHGQALVESLVQKGLNADQLSKLHHLHQIKKIDMQHADQVIGYIQGSGRVPHISGDVAEILAEQTKLLELYPPGQGYEIVSNVILKNSDGKMITDIDHVITHNGEVVNFVNTKIGKRKGREAMEQNKAAIEALQGGHVATVTGSLSIEQLRAVTNLDGCITIGPADAIIQHANDLPYTMTLDYTSEEMKNIGKIVHGVK